MSQGQACMPFHSSPAKNQTIQSHPEKNKFNSKFKNEFGLRKNHIDWNQQMLQCPTLSNRVLRTLKFHTNQSTDLLLHTNTKGFIYAMICLRTNMFFIIATRNNLRASFKQQWYSAHLRNAKFHRTISKGKLRNVMIWPLEKLKTNNVHHLVERKKFWVKTLKVSKIWVKKSFSANTPMISEQPETLMRQQISQQSVCIHTTGSPTVNTTRILSQPCQKPNTTISPQPFSPFSQSSLVHFLREQYSKSDSKATKEQRDFLSCFTRRYGNDDMSQTQIYQPYTPSQTSQEQAKHMQGKSCAHKAAEQAEILSKIDNPYRPETPTQTSQESIPSIAPAVKQHQEQNDRRKLSQDLFKGKVNK